MSNRRANLYDSSSDRAHSITPQTTFTVTPFISILRHDQLTEGPTWPLALSYDSMLCILHGGLKVSDFFVHQTQYRISYQKQDNLLGTVERLKDTLIARRVRTK